MNELKVFDNEMFGSVRVLELDGDIRFVANDIAKALGYKTPQKMYSHISVDDKISINPQSIDYQGLCQNGIILEPNKNTFKMVLINESGLYAAIFGSKLESAKQFKRWVTSEVLPQIRKTGGYIPINEEDTEKEILAKALQIMQNTLSKKDELIKQKEEKLIEQEPMVKAAEMITKVNDEINMSKMAKILQSDYGINIGRNRLFEFLRNRSILMSDNTPYQQFMKYFRVVLNQNYYTGKVTSITLVRGEGILWIAKLIQKEYAL